MMTSSVLGDDCCPQRLSPVLAELSSADLRVYALRYPVGCSVYDAEKHEPPISEDHMWARSSLGAISHTKFGNACATPLPAGSFRTAASGPGGNV
jgi:hypothetical protein